MLQYRQHRPMWHVQGYTRSHSALPLGDYVLCIVPVATRGTDKQTRMIKHANFAGHSVGHRHLAVQYHAHCPEEVQGFTRSHWMLPSSEYFLH